MKFCIEKKKHAFYIYLQFNPIRNTVMLQMKSNAKLIWHLHIQYGNVQPQLENACWAFTFELNYAIILAQLTKGVFQLTV